MPAVDYAAISMEIGEVLRANLGDGYPVLVEEELEFNANTPAIGVYALRRDARQEQRLGAGKRTEYAVRFSIWVWVYGLERLQAIRARDSLLGRIELIMMANREINGLVDTCLLEGGDLPSIRSPEGDGFVAGGELNIVAHVSAILEN